MKITRTVSVNVEVTKVVNLNSLPLSSAPNANNSYIPKDGSGIARITSLKRNPNNRRVYIVSLVEEDLINLIESWGETKEAIEQEMIERNQFYVFEYQLA